MDIPKHPLIPKHVFVTIINKSVALDNVLSLHYTTHTSHPQLSKILNQASSLAKTVIHTSDIQQILEINPDMYVMFKLNDELSIKLSNISQLHQLRKNEFIKKVKIWIESNQDLDEIPKRQSIATTTTTTTSICKSPNKIIKSKQIINKNSPRKYSDLKNDPSKFKFNEKSEPKENSIKGLSLLERIKLKEKLAKEQLSKQITPEEKYQNYLIGKIPMIYDIIYQLYNSQNDNCKSFSTNKLIQIIQDSSNYPVVADEIHDVIKLIQSKLSKIKLIEKNGLQVIRVSYLDRDLDLQIFKVK